MANDKKRNRDKGKKGKKGGEEKGKREKKGKKLSQSPS